MEIRNDLYIGGRWVAPAATGHISVVNPATEEVFARVPDGTEADMDRAVIAARAAFEEGPWPRMSVADRAEIVARIAAGVQSRAAEIATVITNENGTPFAGGMQALAAAMPLHHWAEYGRTHSLEELRGESLVRQEPVGVVAMILPWNVPLALSTVKLGPAWIAGCTVVHKPAPETPLDIMMLAEICEEAGLPPGVLNIVPAGREVGEHLVRHPDVDKVAFTGSTAVGRHIASICGAQVKRVTLELGGKSAAIILDDAEIADAVGALIPHASMMFNGEACIAHTRILVNHDMYDDVVDALCEAVGQLTVGDPHDPATQIGPLVTKRQLDRVIGYIEIGRQEGATVATGGGRPSALDRGWYVEPTVLANVDNHHRVAQEEIFGPVVAVIPYEDEADAVRIANDSIYGLSGGVWTSDPARGVAVAKRIRTGMISVNGGGGGGFDTPFGGMKQSGLGRESGPEGLAAYIEPKTLGLPPGYTYDVT